MKKPVRPVTYPGTDETAWCCEIHADVRMRKMPRAALGSFASRAHLERGAVPECGDCAAEERARLLKQQKMPRNKGAPPPLHGKQPAKPADEKPPAPDEPELTKPADEKPPPKEDAPQ